MELGWIHFDEPWEMRWGPTQLSQKVHPGSGAEEMRGVFGGWWRGWYPSQAVVRDAPKTELG